MSLSPEDAQVEEGTQLAQLHARGALPVLNGAASVHRELPSLPAHTAGPGQEGQGRVALWAFL